MRGYIIYAPYEKDVEAAEILALTLDGNISIATLSPSLVSSQYNALEIPWGYTGHDEWKLFHVTPYKSTIVLKYNMSNVSNDLWDIVEHYDFALATPSLHTKFLDNQSIKTYSGSFMFFKRRDLAVQAMKMADEIFQQWGEIRHTAFDAPTPETPTSDMVWSIIVSWLDIPMPIIPINTISRPTNIKYHSLIEKDI